MIEQKYQPFRFWCQKVLPLVYDDSLSYYELLCKVVNYLNNMIKDTNLIIDSFNTLENYVKTYFDNLDIQDEINNKLDEMAESGALESLVIEATTDNFSAMRRKLLAMTGELRKVTQDDRVIHNRVASITDYEDEVTGEVYYKRITFARGNATYTIIFNTRTPERYGFLYAVRGYAIQLSQLYGEYAETGNEITTVYANGAPINPFDLTLEQEFTDLTIVKQVDTGKWVILVADVTGLHLYYHYPEDIGHLPRIRRYQTPAFDVKLSLDGFEIQTPGSDKMILTNGYKTFTPGDWYKFDIIL